VHPRVACGEAPASSPRVRAPGWLRDDLAMTKLVPSGPMAWLVECSDPVGFLAAVTADPAPVAIVDVVPAARTVLVTLADRRELTAARDWLEGLSPTTSTEFIGQMVEIPVHYDGDDLSEVAVAAGRSVDEVIARHSAGEYVSAFCGFAPGFAYLTGLDPALHLPRRATPRTRVPAGSVAIAAGYAAVYPSVSPGGWHLLGHTDTTLWDLDRVPPALLTPGTRVRFVAVS
jgi:KipI family sensor histidine kinase inhibitor